MQHPCVISALIAVVALLLAQPARGTNTSCVEQPVDVHLVFEVRSWSCNFYRPGDASIYGPDSVPFTGRGSDGGDMQECILINGSFPGPLIRAKVGDVVRIDVINLLVSTPINIHWHGLSVKGTPWSDGTGGINACPVVPGRPATQIFTVYRPGLFFYHGHQGLEDEYGLSGPLLVDDPNDPYTDLYDEEWPNVTITVRDFWRAPNAHQGQGLAFLYYEKYTPFGIPLINGYWGNGSDAMNLPYYVMNVAVDTCYRVYFLSGNSEWPGWFVNITDSSGTALNMTLISLTAQQLQPRNTNSIALYLAQRAQVIFCTPAEPQDLNITFSPASTEAGTCDNTVVRSPDQALNPAPIGPDCVDTVSAIIRVGTWNATKPKTANRTKLASFPFSPVIDSLPHPELIVPLTPVVVPNKHTNNPPDWVLQTGIIAPGVMYTWDYRLYQFALPTAPPLFTHAKCGTRKGVNDVPIQQQAPIQYLQKAAHTNDVIDIIFNNLSPFMHPMHLHGFHFTVLASKWIVESGYQNLPQYTCNNSYVWANPALDGISGEVASEPQNYYTYLPFLFGCPYNASDPTNSMYDLANPYTTDIVPVPAHSWVKVRVKLDNPGYWYLHCHINAHMLHGMGLVVEVGTDHIPPIPSWVDTSCMGPCAPTNQVCGPYARRNCIKPKPTDYCPPSAIDDSSEYYRRM